MRSLSPSAAALSAVVVSIGLLPASDPRQVVHDSFKDFAQGSFADAGAGIYVTQRGTIESIHRWDLNGDGFLDLVFANSHPHAEKLDATIYWGNGDNFDILRSTPVVTNGAQRTIVADVNGDGGPDLVLPNYHNGTHDRMDSFIYLHQPGVNPYSIERRIGLPTQGAQHAAVADFNRDGYMDVAFAFSGGFWEYRADPWNPYQSHSRIYWGARDGYSASRFGEIPTPATAALAAADLNGDGWPDLAVASHESKTKRDVDSHVYWGGPQGFSESRRVALPTRAANMVRTGDLNGDHKPDVIFANGDGASSYIYFADGGSFSLSRRLELPTWDARDIAIADFNADGHPDIAFANYSDHGNPLAYSDIYFGSAAGYSAERRMRLESVGASGLAAADLNNDGLPELVIACFRDFTSHDVPSYIYWNSRQGFDTLRRTSLYTHGAGGAAIADFNQDGHPDLLLNNTTDGYRGGFHPVFVYWGDKEGRYSPERRLLLPAVDAYEHAAADLNQDGYSDLIIANSGEDRRPSQESTVFWGGSQGFSINRASGLTGNKALGALVADLDKDGYLDIVLCNSGSIGDQDPGSFIYWGSQSGYSPVRRTAIPTDGATSGSIADMNGDGHLDLIFDSSRSDRGVVIYWGYGSRNYDKSRRSFVPGSAGVSTVEVADLNKDGFIDLIGARAGALHTPDGISQVYWGSASGELSVNRRSDIPTEGTNGITVADLNRDGWLDLVFPNYGTGKSRTGNSRIFWGGPKGYSEDSMLLLPTDGGTGAWAADFNRDGYPDLLLLCHRREGDPNQKGRFNEHRTNSFLYWGGAEGFRADHRLEIPGEGIHNGRTLDIGNIIDRRYQYEYVSAPVRGQATKSVRLSWQAETRNGSSLSFQLRSAISSDAMARAQWHRPESAGDSEVRFAVSGGWIQYRVEFLSPDGITYPVLDKVTMYFE